MAPSLPLLVAALGLWSACAVVGQSCPAGSVIASTRYCSGDGLVVCLGDGKFSCTFAPGTTGRFIVPPLAVSTIGLAVRGGDGGNNGRPNLDFSLGGSGALIEIPAVPVQPGQHFGLFAGGAGGSPPNGNFPQSSASGNPGFGGRSAYPGLVGADGGRGAGTTLVFPGGSGGGAASLVVLYDATLNPLTATPIALAGAGGGASFSGNVPRPTGGHAGRLGEPGGDGYQFGSFPTFGRGASVCSPTVTARSGGAGGSVSYEGTPGLAGTAYRNSGLGGTGGQGGSAQVNTGHEGGAGGASGCAAGGGGAGGYFSGPGGGGSSGIFISGVGSGTSVNATPQQTRQGYITVTFNAGPTISGSPANMRRQTAAQRARRLARLERFEAFLARRRQ